MMMTLYWLIQLYCSSVSGVGFVECVLMREGKRESVGKGRLGGESKDGRHEEEWEGREQVM